MTISSDRVRALREAIDVLKELRIGLEMPASGPALSFLLSANLAVRNETLSGSSPGADTSRDETPEPLTRAVEWTGAKAEALLDLVQFGDNGVAPVIYHGRLPKGKAERQRILAALKLGLDKVAYGIDQLNARVLNEICARYECVDQNLPTNLQKSGIANRTGARGSYVYKLTLKGQDLAREAILTLVEET